MIDKEDDNGSAGERVGERNEFRPSLQRFRQGDYVWLDGEHLQSSISEMRGNLDRRRFTKVINVRLEGEAEASNDGVLTSGRANLGDDVMRLRVVHFPSRAQEARLGRCGVDDEPRVDGDAVSADTGSWLKDLHARVAIGQADEFPDIDAQLVADQRELIGKGDVDVAVSVLGQLR